MLVLAMRGRFDGLFALEPKVPSRLTEQLDHQRHAARTRPGDPISWAQYAIAAARHPDARAEAETALMRTHELIESCLNFGLLTPAKEAASLLFEALPHRDTALLLADLELAQADANAISRARELLEAFIEQHPDADAIRVRIAALALGASDPQGARTWIEPIADHSAETRALYIQTLAALGEWQLAAHEALLGLEVEPEATDLHLLLGVAELAQERHHAAISAFSEAIRLSPERPEAYLNLGLAFRDSGSLAAALGVVDAGLELMPEHTHLLALRAELIENLNL